MRTTLTLLALAEVSTFAFGYDIPDNLRDIYSNHKSGKCNNKLAGGFDDGSFAYCGDIPHAIYLHSQRNGGRYDNMDIDCDGANRSAGRCSNDPTGQGETAFKDTVKQYGISDLDANKHPYVVFGNSGSNPSFNPEDEHMHPLSVMAVVCNNQVHYGVWGDTNGGTSTGEASLALANLCFPNDSLSGDNGHGEYDVMYIGFKGTHAVPGDSANWKAGSAKDFQSSIKDLGDSLVAQLSG
ncbi:unnamed protein product [Zymoseptoria tritici ST99CH_1A5]|uniref:Endo-chitosanase n=1 Tax=Zymoseptoria tritici ST99CH_1A5 TaxID=1276529 RepID=A0A1Y6LWC3_ZYMTR|nr:unnamed protein product [Zymoseptoria tritici ST99CH_3D1]SMY28686.1 unnamed protein product [Zymoseptoria tritici ST99CH_1A5]